VTLPGAFPQALETRIGGIRAAYEANVAKGTLSEAPCMPCPRPVHDTSWSLPAGKLSEDKLGARMRCITTATSLDDPACSTAGQ